jgi:DNA-binding CsgD family transcriptional regulator/tetratricopeptide (TPR) repeat protein
LASKSLVRLIEQGDSEDPRLGMLETVREYAWEQLVASGEAEVLRRRHADYYLALAERVGPDMKGPGQATSQATLVAEQDNLRAALQSLLEREELARSDAALRLIRALHNYWQQHMHVSEFRGWLDRALAQAGPGPTPLLAWSLQRAASLARWQGDFQRAKALGEESLAMARDLGDEFEVANALNALGGIALYQDDYETAAALSGDALIKYRQLGAENEVATTLGNLGLAALYKGDFERAEEYYRECIRLLREAGHGASALVALTNLGYAAHYQGDSRRAKEIFVETLTVTLKIDPQRSSARALAGVAATMLAEAAQHPKSASQDLQIVAHAAQLLGMSEVRRERGGGNFDPRGQAEFERNVATARMLLGEEAFNKTWVQGGTLTLEQAVELATRHYKHEDENKPRGRGRPIKRVAGGLTDREYDVAALVERGMTNAEIAGQLVLSVRTVEAHVANAMQKLGLHTRSEFAAWAVREGIVPRSAQE